MPITNVKTKESKTSLVGIPQSQMPRSGLGACALPSACFGRGKRRETPGRGQQHTISPLPEPASIEVFGRTNDTIAEREKHTRPPSSVVQIRRERHSQRRPLTRMLFWLSYMTLP